MKKKWESVKIKLDQKMVNVKQTEVVILRRKIAVWINNFIVILVNQCSQTFPSF